MHYYKLFFRSALFIIALVIYIYDRLNGNAHLFTKLSTHPLILAIIWVVFTIEMILRFFPSKIESRGCQKQFKQNFVPSPENHKNSVTVEAHVPPKHSTLMVLSFWVILNGLIGVLYFNNIIDKGILFLIALAYSICDMICILHPERFEESTNYHLACANCTEKLCHHKKALRGFLAKQRQLLHSSKQLNK